MFGMAGREGRLLLKRRMRPHIPALRGPCDHFMTIYVTPESYYRARREHPENFAPIEPKEDH
jgi:hypothetical protein